MDRTYKIPDRTSKWHLLCFPVLLLTQYSGLLKHWKEFGADPTFKNGWVMFTWATIIIIAIILQFRRQKAAHVISINDGILRFQRILGDKSWKPEVVTTVIESSRSYLLYSDDKEICVSKKLIPEELNQYLNSCTIRTKMENKTLHPTADQL